MLLRLTHRDIAQRRWIRKQKLDVVDPAEDDQAALKSKEAQVIGERYKKLSLIYY